MALVELQLAEATFFEVLKAEVIRIPLPGAALDQLAAFRALTGEGDLFVERIECTGISHAAATPATGPVPPGQLLLALDVTVHLTSAARALTAGHLAPPSTIPFAAKAWMRLALVDQQLEYHLVASEPEGLGGSGVLPLRLQLPLLLPAFSPGAGKYFPRALLAGPGVVALRLGTRLDDDALAPVVNRLGVDHWGLFVPGAALGQQLVFALRTAADEAVATSTSPKLETTQEANGGWAAAERRAHAAVGLKAVDAGPVDFDLPFRIEATLTPSISVVSTGAIFRMDTRLQWIAEGLLDDLGLAQDPIDEAVTDHLRGPPDGMEELARGADFVEYRITAYLDAPASRTFTGTTATGAVDGSGVAVAGTIAVRPPPTATWTVALPCWHVDGDCRTKNARQVLEPAQVRLVGSDPWYPLHLRHDSAIYPPGFWAPRQEPSMPGAQPVTLDVAMRPPPGLLGDVPAGVATSVVLVTSVGVRWVALGVTPARPEVTEDELLGETFRLVSTCMAISDRWGMGLLNLDWLVDPPAHEATLPPLQEWLVTDHGLDRVRAVELVAVDARGSRRALGRAPVTSGVLAVRVVTDAGEALELRADGDVATRRPPNVAHRWIAPTLTVPGEADVRAFALEGATLRVLRADGRLDEFTIGDGAATLVRAIAHGERRFAVLADAGAGRARAWSRDRPLGLPTLDAAGASVAVAHRGAVVLGTASPFRPYAFEARSRRGATPEPHAEARLH
ncbi:MAG TPA: hypothetical protein VEB43_18845 [Anaeromyxobacter sp.]|nr:hypothetical protein [Anaeromyxobacter sp.]